MERLRNAYRRRKAGTAATSENDNNPLSNESRPTTRTLGRQRKMFLAFFLTITALSSITRAAIQNPNHPARLLVISALRAIAPAVLRPFRSECHRYRTQGRKKLLRRDSGDNNNNNNNATNTTTKGEIRFGVALQMYPPLDKGWTPEKLSTFHIAQENRIEYCKRHGYEYLNGTAWSEQRPELLKRLDGRNVWLKSLFVLDALRNRTELDYILYLDDDAIIMDLDRPLLSLVSDLEPGEAIVVAPEAREDAFINAGGFVVASNPAGVEIMEVWASGAWKGLKHDQPYFNGLFDDEGKLKPWRKSSDGGGANEASNNSTLQISPRYKLVPPCALQNGGGVEWSPYHGRIYAEGFHAKGDFAVHFYGRPDKAEQVKIASKGSFGFISR